MRFQPVQMEHYRRREHFEHFTKLNLTYSATVPIEITNLRAGLKRRGLRTYAAQIWMLATAANLVPEFRMSLDEDGQLGFWDSLSPLYTVLCDATQSFSGIWTEYHPAFGNFYASCLADIEQFNNGSFLPQGEPPGNVLNVSSIPWVDFTAFNLNMPTTYLLPILTIGKFEERNGSTFMPLSIQVHHAVCDGYHLGQFVDRVKTLAATPEDWLVG